jgi:hypothetical protein
MQSHCAAHGVSKRALKIYISSIASAFDTNFQENAMSFAATYSFAHHTAQALHTLQIKCSMRIAQASCWLASSARRHLQRSATTQHRY